MGKSTRKKQEEDAAREREATRRLSARNANSGKIYRGVITATDVMTGVIYRHSDRFLRKPSTWRYTGKSKKNEKQRLELVRHLFANYHAPRFLENVITANGEEAADYSSWYVAVAQGDSWYKNCAKGTLSKRETHLFLQAPETLSFKEAIWWAKAMALSDDVGVAYRMARSSISQRGSYKEDFWIDVHRFFTLNPVQLKDLDELLDYIMAEQRENENWTIKKRSLEAIRRKSEEWHRAQYKMRHIGGGSWDGIDVPNWSTKTGKFDPNPQRNLQIIWHIKQILTGNDLSHEGQRMRHCVSSYKSSCMEGKTAIFSMTSDTAVSIGRRNLTIEVVNRTIRQVRGFANRLARPQEKTILRRWAIANSLNYSSSY